MTLHHAKPLKRRVPEDAEIQHLDLAFGKAFAKPRFELTRIRLGVAHVGAERPRIAETDDPEGSRRFRRQGNSRSRNPSVFSAISQTGLSARWSGTAGRNRRRLDARSSSVRAGPKTST